MTKVCNALRESRAFLSSAFPAGVINASVTVIGYAAIDSPTEAGFICDRNGSSVNQEAIEVMCRNLGFRYGRKWPHGIYGDPRSLIGFDEDQAVRFMFAKMNCFGDESSVFECDLGPWGEHECTDEELLTVACSQVPPCDSPSVPRSCHFLEAMHKNLGIGDTSL